MGFTVSQTGAFLPLHNYLFPNGAAHLSLCPLQPLLTLQTRGQIVPTPFPVPAAPPATTRTQAAQGWELWSHTPRNAPGQAGRLHACLLVLPLSLLFFSLTFCLRKAPPSLLITNHSHQPPRKHSGATWLLTGH